MKFKKFLLALTGFTLLVTGCYRDDIILLQKQVEELNLNGVQKQVDQIEATVNLLQQADFQKGIDAVSNTLTEKEKSLLTQINELKTQISAAAGSSDVETLEAKLASLETQMIQVQNSITVIEGFDFNKIIGDLQTLITANNNKYDTEIAALQNQFAGLDLDNKISELKAAYEIAIANSDKELKQYFNSNFQAKFEELMNGTQEMVLSWVSNSDSFKDLVREYQELQDQVTSQIQVIGLRGAEIDRLTTMAASVNYDIRNAISNAIQTLQLGDIKSIKDNADVLSSEVANIKSDVAQLKELPGKIGEFTKLQTTLVDAVVALQEQAMADGEQTLKDLVLALKANLSDANNKLVDIKDIINLINANSNQISVNRDSIGINAAAIRQLAADMSKLPTQAVVDGLDSEIKKIQKGEVGEYNLGDIVSSISALTTALADSDYESIGGLIAQIDALVESLGTSTDGSDKKTVYGLIAALNAQVAAINTGIADIDDIRQTAKTNKENLAKANENISKLDDRIKAIEDKDITSLINRIAALEETVGEGTLATTSQTLKGAINELVDALDKVKDPTVEGSIMNLIAALQADVLAIEGGADMSTVNLLKLSEQITALKTTVDGYDNINFDSKKGSEALKSLVVAVTGIQTTIADDLVTNETIKAYLKKDEAAGLYQTIEAFKSVIGDGATPAAGTVLARIATLEAAAVTLTGESSSRTFADAINFVFDKLNAHAAEYHVTEAVITGIQNDITSINTLLKSEGQTLDNGFTATTVIGALNELKTNLESVEGSFENYLGTDALDSLATQKMVTSLKTSVEKAHQDLINAMLGVTSGGTAAQAGALVQQLKTTLDALNKDLWKFNIGGTGEYTIQGAINELNTRITAVNTIVGEGFKDKEGKTVSITDYVKDVETALNKLSGDSNTALDTVKQNIRNELAALNTSIVNAVLGTEGSMEDLKTLNLTKLDSRVTAIENAYATKEELNSAISQISGDLGGLYTNAQIDSMASAIVNAFYNEEGSAASTLDSLKAVKTMISKFKSDIATALTALDKIGKTSYTGESLTAAIAALQTAVGTLGETVGASDKGLVKAVADINSEITGIKTTFESYYTKDEIDGLLSTISGDLGGLYTNAQIDSMASAIVNAFYNEEGSAASTLDSLKAVKTMISKFKSDIATALTALDKIGNTSYTGESLTAAIAALQTAVGTLGETVGDKDKGLVNAVADINTTLNGLSDIPGRVESIETQLVSINETLGGAATQEALAAAVKDIVEAIYLGDKENPELSDVTALMKEFQAEIEKIGDGFGTTTLTEAITALLNAVGTDGESATGIYAELKKLADSISELKDTIASLTDIVQSIVYVPEYEDGMIYVDGVYNEETPQVYDNPNRNIEVDFRVNTFRGYEFKPDNYSFKGYITSTKMPTKAYATGGEGFEMKFLSYEGKILALQFNSKEITDNAFWSGNAGASIAVEVIEKNGSNSLTTEYIPLKLNRKTENPGDPGEETEEPQGVKFVVSPTERSVGNAGGQVEITVNSSRYWILEGATNSRGIYNFDDRYGNITATVPGSQVANPYFIGTQTVYFYVPAYTNRRATDNGKAPGDTLKYTFTFNEYDSNVQSSAHKTGTATLTITQTPRETQVLTADPASCMEGITVEWDEVDTTFVVRPSDQRNDFKCELQSDSFVSVNRVNGLAGTAEITLTFTPRAKTQEGYYGERVTQLTLTSATGEIKDITITQRPHPAGDFEFLAGTEGETVVDSLTQAGTGVAHTFAYNEYGTDNAFRFRVVPSDELGDWEYSDTGASAYTVSVGNPDANGVKLVTVYPNAFNENYSNPVEGSIVFTLADGVTKRTLKFVQSKREESALTVDTTPISFSWDGYYVEGETKTAEDTVHVSVVAADGFNDWVVVDNPGWVEVDLADKANGIAVISVSNDPYVSDFARNDVVTFCIKSENTEYNQTVAITQGVRNTEEEKPTLTITSGGAQFTGKAFNWNASESEEGVTISVASGFSGDLDFGDKSENFDEWFTVTPEPTPRTKAAAAPTTNNYTITPKKVNNDWANDVVETIKFVSISDGGNGLAQSEEATLTFTIKARGSVEGDGATPTVKINNETGKDSTIVFDHNGNVKDMDSKNSTIVIAAGTYSEDIWNISKDSDFEECFTLTEDPANSGNYTVKVKDDSVLDNEAHEGKLTITPKAGEGHDGTPVVITFKIEEYVQTLKFTKQTEYSYMSPKIEAISTYPDTDEPATLEFTTSKSSFQYSPMSSTASSWNNIVAIGVTPPDGDTEKWKAEITGNDFVFSTTTSGSTSRQPTTSATLNDGEGASGNLTLYVHAENANTGAEKTGTLKITSASGIEYTFDLKQEAYVQITSIAIKQGDEEVTTYDLPLKVKSGYNSRVAGTVTFTATAQPVGYQSTIKWTSSNEEVATVDASGKVTAVKAGTVMITAYSSDNDNVKATCTVNVLQTYWKLTSGNPTAGKVYLIAGASDVSNKTPILTQQAGKNTDYQDENGVIVGDLSSCEFTYYTLGNNTSTTRYWRINGSNSGYYKYLYIKSSMGSYSIMLSDQTNSTNANTLRNYVWSTVTYKNLQSNSRYLYYNNNFTTSSSSQTIRLYVKE